MTSRKVSIAAFAGSLRKKSFNRGLLRAVVALAPPDVEIRVVDIDDLPLFNADLEDETNPLPPVKRLCDAIKGADALLIVTPEYNYSIPAVTKNVLDWASRTDGVLDDKPTALMGASPGGFGTVRCQFHLRQAAVENNMHVLNEPELYVSRARTKFDENGDLTDEDTRKHVVELLEALAAFARRLNQGNAQSVRS
jgi:chromate reductase, NAD(P)H dehydrogenase (quinone)